ncbi:MAG: hypothetical protein LC648_04250 [Novosphingobium sp.]|nr:hypothetical protein [Novosphingobium sp.]
MAIAPQAPAAPMAVIRTSLDQRAGIDFPALFDTVVTLAGPLAAQLQPLVALPPSSERDEAIDGLIVAVMGESQIIERKLAGDPGQGVVTVSARGLQTTAWKWEDRRASFVPRLPNSDFEFAPDRARAAWRAIPVELGAPHRGRMELEVLLPEGGRGVTIEGASFHGSVARRQVDREARIEAGKLIVTEEEAVAGGELPAGEIAGERGKAAALKAGALRLRAPVDAKRRWQVVSPEARRKLKPIEDAYARLIAADPESAENFLNRASFLAGIGDHRAAIKDYDKAVALDPGAETYWRRAVALEVAGDVAAALADARKADEIAPEPWRAGAIARLLAEEGKAAEGLDLIEAALDNPGEAKVGLVATRSDLLARLGRKDEGLEAISALLADRPGDANVLNSRCWYRGVWAHALDDALADCNRAIESSSWTPPVLDSRALANFRLGRLEAALADANAALDQAGAQTQTLLLRGVIRKKMGDPAGDADIAEALRRQPGLKREYASYGLLP